MPSKPAPVTVSDIKTFFTKSTRNENDLTNRVRENVLKIIHNPPKEYLEDSEFGTLWNLVHQQWNNALQKIAVDTNIPHYTSIKIKARGGRRCHYDVDVMYYNENTLVANRKIEFKNGGKNIESQPQFLSLQTKFQLISITYCAFWHENYLDKYLACDPEITEPKPAKDVYLKHVTKTNYSTTPFFAQLKKRELFFQPEKNAVVNASIKDYLEKHGKEIDIATFSEKVQKTQMDKIFLLWSDGQFCVDSLSEKEMSGMTFHSIKNGNVLELKSGNTIYGLLLRWRNHKGILNPAWQISMKRKPD